MLDFALHPASGFGNIDGSNRSTNPLNHKANRDSDRHRFRRRILIRVGRCDLSVPRSSETRVPNVIGKDEKSAEATISDAGLNFRVRARRATSEAKTRHRSCPIALRGRSRESWSDGRGGHQSPDGKWRISRAG